MIQARNARVINESRCYKKFKKNIHITPNSQKSNLATYHILLHAQVAVAVAEGAHGHPCSHCHREQFDPGFQWVAGCLQAAVKAAAASAAELE